MASSASSRTALDEMSKTGEFKRRDAAWRKWIKKGGEHPPEANRYHLYVCYACPWASRCLAVLHMKGLQDIIGVSATHPTWNKTRPDSPEDAHTGWIFRSPDDPPVKHLASDATIDCAGCIPDTVNGCKTIRELYDLAGDTDGKYSVPVLWDKKLKTIVSNESSEIIRMFNTEFNEWSSNPELNLYPEGLRSTIDAVNDWVYPGINNGVYRCGFATTQTAYEQAAAELSAAMDRAEELLSKQRYLAGDVLTEADIRLFVTLVRFDEVYVVYFKTSMRCLREYPNLLNHTREIYQLPGVKASVNMDHIKRHYFTSHPKLNSYGIIPVGPGVLADLEKPHDRSRF